MKKLLNGIVPWVLPFSLFILSGCGGGADGGTKDIVPIVTPASISISPVTPGILPGNTLQFAATGTYPDDTTEDVTSRATWTSSSTTHASITDTGLATGIAEGTTTIKATLGGKSDSTMLTVSTIALAPTITTQPTNQSVTEGLPATFHVTASGTVPLAYQWKKNGTNVGTNSSTYTTPATTVADDGAKFSVVVNNSAGSATSAEATLTVSALPTGVVRIAYLHHSTGGNIWGGGVPEFFTAYNASHGTQYQITSITYPASPAAGYNSSNGYPWDNYPYDYWNLWVNHTGSSQDRGELNLDQIAENYDVIVFKHCFPVSGIGADDGNPSVSSSIKTTANYKLQYAALKTRMKAFSTKKFILWTGAALNEGSTNAGNAQRARDFFNWVKNSWDESGDNIFIWDFYELETEGSLYMNDAYDSGTTDSHPNASFSTTVAPYIAQRIVDVIEGRGDTGSITGH